jgi:hypothetical protein
MQKTAKANRFLKGIVTDIANSDKPQDTWVDALNVRLTESEQGYHASNIGGNSPAFSLTPGYTPIGSDSYGGVLFIFSVNGNTGETEIGTYPSPNYTTTGYTYTYKPLQSFTLDTPSAAPDDCLPFENVNLTDFRVRMGMNCKYPLQIKIREDFDGSVNLYCVDNYSPNKSFNSGFIIATGLYNGRYTSALQVESGASNLLNESNYHPIITLTNTQSGGKLKAGHYYFFVRYTDNNYNTTSFLGGSKVVPIFNEKIVTLAQGNITTVPTTYGGEPLSDTNMLANLTISNLDISAQFVEIGYAHYYSDTEYRSVIIDNRYRTNGTSSITVKITGNESLIPTTIDVLTQYKPTEALIAKTIAQLNNILYMANMRGVQLDHPDLRRFCCAIELKEDTSYKRTVAHNEPPSGNSSQILYASLEKDVHEKVGYWSEETYVFGVVPVFKGGFVGRAFPVTGFDNINGTSINPNKQGIFRFSNANTTPYYGGFFTSLNNQATVKGIAFDTTNAKAIFAGSSWLQENVIGFYFVRGERNKNILYQGLAVRCYNGGNTRNNESGTGWSNDYNIKENKWLPLLDGFYYSYKSRTDRGTSNTANDFESVYESGGSTNQPLPVDKLGVFSVDYHLDTDEVPEQAHLSVVGNASLSLATNGSLSDRNLPFITNYTTVAPPINQGLVAYEQQDMSTQVLRADRKCVPVQAYTANSNRGFVSKVTEGVSAGDEGLFWARNEENFLIDNEVSTYGNLPMALPKYIGIENIAVDDGRWNKRVVNICRTNAEQLDYIDLYDFKNTFFSPISDFIDIGKIINVATNQHLFYHGDCFIARAYLKVCAGYTDEIGDELITLLTKKYTGSRWYGTRYTETFTPADTLPNGWGHYISVVMEHNYNPNYRYEKGRNLCYPISGQDYPGKAFAWILDSPESNFYNTGYKRMLSPRAYLGIDRYEPIVENRFPTRIRPSIPHIFRAVKDGYREFSGGAFDFSYDYGEINALVAFNDILYSMQASAINEHPVQERANAPTSNGDTIVTAQQIGLTSYKRTISDKIGTQHRDSVVTSEAAIYGIDYARKIWWRIAGSGVEPISETKQAETWVKSALNINSRRGDIIATLEESYPCGNGILCYYDAEEREVLMTIHYNDQAQTLCFAEKIDAFTTKYSFAPRHYANIKNDMYTFGNGLFWLHGENSNRSTFYDILHNWFIRFVSNGEAPLLKNWDNMDINSNNVELSYVIYETQHQKAIQNPFIPLNEFWYLPRYRQHIWHLPIRRADVTTNPDISLYEPKSPMVGVWLSVEIGYLGNKPLQIQGTLIYSREKPKT